MASLCEPPRGAIMGRNKKTTVNRKHDQYSLFGCTSSYEDSELILLSVPWSATASFGGGADKGPEMIAQASSQMDFFSIEEGDIRDQGICLLSSPDFLKTLNKKTRDKALPIIKLEEEAPGTFPKALLEEINQSCHQMVKWVYEQTKTIHQEGKKFGLVGGDHSTSEGAIRYFGELYKGDFGILHIDAHADLRNSYQGFQHSHASVMYNVMKQTYPPALLLQLGVRDYCEEEYLFIKENKNVHTFFDSKINTALFEGQTWKSFVDTLIQLLPKNIYISMDVDGLESHLFPHTGTPVPGGLSFAQTDYLLNKLSQSHCQIIGFDLVEVAAPAGALNIWDAQVGAHLLYKLCQISITH